MPQPTKSNPSPTFRKPVAVNGALATKFTPNGQSGGGRASFGLVRVTMPQKEKEGEDVHDASPTWTLINPGSENAIWNETVPPLPKANKGATPNGEVIRTEKPSPEKSANLSSPKRSMVP